MTVNATRSLDVALFRRPAYKGSVFDPRDDSHPMSPLCCHAGALWGVRSGAADGSPMTRASIARRNTQALAGFRTSTRLDNARSTTAQTGSLDLPRHIGPESDSARRGRW